MTINPGFALLVRVVLFSVEVMYCLLASGQNLEMHYYLTVCNEKGMCILKFVYASLFRSCWKAKTLRRDLGLHLESSRYGKT